MTGRGGGRSSAVLMSRRAHELDLPLWRNRDAPPVGAECRVLHGAGRGAIGLAACNCAKVGVVALAAITLSAMPDTSYASCGDLSLAYQVFGDGPVELVFVGPFASHVELFWTLPEFKAFFEQLATFCRVVLFDKAGLGLSDPVPKFRTLDDRATEIEAVMDTVGFEKAAIFGMSDGGPAAIVFAAKRPQRTRALILYGSYPYMPFEWDDIDRDPAEMLTRGLAEFPSWARIYPRSMSTGCRWSRSPADRNSAAPSARRGAAVRHSRVLCRRPGRYVSSPCSSA